MVVIPAIDIQAGRCVRLRQGVMAEATVYSDDPAETARRWEAEGATLLHVVDLDGAIEGRPINTEAVQAILAAVRIPIQIGGGIRTLSAIRRYLAGGASRVVLGSSLVFAPELVREASAEFPNRILASIDARDGNVAVEGWETATAIDAVRLVRALDGAALPAVVFTDIRRDGMLEGPNVEAIRRFAAQSPFPVLASGGVSSLEDVRMLAAIPRLEGVIVGKALYTGAVRLGEALAAAGGR